SPPSTTRHPPIPTHFPYTTLFRSKKGSPPRSRIMRRAAATPRGSPSTAKGTPWREGLEPRTKLMSGCRDAVAPPARRRVPSSSRSEEHTSELQSPYDLVCRLLLEK